MCGWHHTKEAKKKIREANSGEKNYNFGKLDEKAPHWKGDDVGYHAVHVWVRKHKTNKKQCEKCGLEKTLELANISETYKRDITDYLWLCRSCHKRYDKQKKMDELRRIFSI